MDHLFRLKACLHRVIIILKASNIKAFSLKADIHTVFPVFQLIDAPKTTGIIPPVFTPLQHLHTGAVYHMELLGDIFLILNLETPAASVISMDKPAFCHIRLISTVAAAVPVD